MPRPKMTYAGEARGLVTHRKPTETVLRLNRKQVEMLVRHLQRAAQLPGDVVLVAHSGRRTGPMKAHLIEVRTSNTQKPLDFTPEENEAADERTEPLAA
jgi:hypothetical protein